MVFFSEAVDKRFVVIIPSYNNQEWYQQNLESVFCQDYGNYRVIYIDDCSKDNTGELVDDFIRKNNQDFRCTLIKNRVRRGALANLYVACYLCEKDEIMVFLDGDDWFIDAHVLSYLNEVYQDDNVWMTYGQYMRYPDNECLLRLLPQEVINAGKARYWGFITSHLRTCYAALYQRIEKEDLLCKGEFFPVAWDVAMMIPMLEMAGPHVKGITKVLYVYNVATALSDQKKDPGLIIDLDAFIRTLKPYKRLEKLFV